MNTVIFHFTSGDAFFGGFLVVVVGALVTATSRGRRHRIGSAAILIGWVFVIASATALPFRYYFLPAVFSILAMAALPPDSTLKSEKVARETSVRLKWSLLGLRMCPILCLSVLGVVLSELGGYHPTHIRVPRHRPLFVIGDSLSAGINDGVDVPWPARLNELTSVEVSNHAQAGATCRSALNQLSGLPKQCVVIVEIGGNDLLSGRSSSDFRADLEALLSEIQTPDRDVVMFELPLPPFFNGYGYAQRELAAKHKVALIPRRRLASVLFSQDATLDSIHLSDQGHQRLAEGVAEILSLDSPE